MRIGRRGRGGRAGAAVTAVFAAGVALRVAFLALYRPAFLGDPDGGSYLYAAGHHLFANVYDPAGYPLLVRALHLLIPHLTALVALQHALAVASAWLLFRAVRRASGSGAAALLPAGVVLFDGYSLWVEHTPLTETAFSFLVVAASVCALRAAEGPRTWVLGAGLLAGLAGTFRPVGFVLVLPLGIWLACLPGPRARRAAAVCGLLAPVLAIAGGYVLLQRAQTGYTGLTQDSGRVLYARAAPFADCRDFTPPRGTRSLCETTPPARRGSFNQYLTGYPDHPAGTVTDAARRISPAWRVFGPPPAGDGRLRAFGTSAILHQPLDYLRVVASDFAYAWRDDHRAFIRSDARPDAQVRSIAASFDGTRAQTGTAPELLQWYGRNIQISGLLMIALLLAPLAGLILGRGPARRAAALFAGVGWLLPVAADAAASWDPRFAMPAYGPLAAAAALGLAHRRRRRG